MHVKAGQLTANHIQSITQAGTPVRTQVKTSSKYIHNRLLASPDHQSQIGSQNRDTEGLMHFGLALMYWNHNQRMVKAGRIVNPARSGDR